MKKLLALTIPLVAVALVGTALAATSHAGAGRTIVLTWRQSDYAKATFVDTAPKSPTGNPDHISPGDVLVDSNTIRNAAGTPVGTAYEVLTFITPSVGFKSVDLAQEVYVLSDGEIVTTAVHGPHVPGADPITGGSGAYAGARGTVVEVSPDNAKVTKLAIHLLP